jgi:hypothetical protein
MVIETDLLYYQLEDKKHRIFFKKLKKEKELENSRQKTRFYYENGRKKHYRSKKLKRYQYMQLHCKNMKVCYNCKIMSYVN